MQNRCETCGKKICLRQVKAYGKEYTLCQNPKCYSSLNKTLHKIRTADKNKRKVKIQPLKSFPSGHVIFCDASIAKESAYASISAVGYFSKKFLEAKSEIVALNGATMGIHVAEFKAVLLAVAMAGPGSIIVSDNNFSTSFKSIPEAANLLNECKRKRITIIYKKDCPFSTDLHDAAHKMCSYANDIAIKFRMA